MENQIDASIHKLGSTLNKGPKFGLYYINDHVLNLNGKLHQTQAEL
jgi:hypothetical protein